MAKLESDFVRDVLHPRLKAKFPGIVIIKQDPNTSFQGVPDHLLLYEDHWAALESKRATNAQRRPNQEHHVERLNKLSYANFVHPDNIEEVMDDLQAAFRPRR